ncbi:MAG TPA: hypothetical protein VEO92_01955 [Candidatus Nitrosocosmicus sp.]|nr:hypothetical protein [Candidatus Nitrosocosmicus sp.]
MTEHNDQLTRPQLVGMLLLGVCIWAIIVGVIYAIAADNRFPGFVIAVTGFIGSYIMHRWLIYVNEPKE